MRNEDGKCYQEENFRRSFTKKCPKCGRCVVVAFNAYEKHFASCKGKKNTQPVADGRSWYCDGCGTRNRADATECKVCRAVKPRKK